MSLNKFTDVQKGLDLELQVGCDTLKANNIDIISADVDNLLVNGTFEVKGTAFTDDILSTGSITAQGITGTSFGIGVNVFPTSTALAYGQILQSVNGSDSLQYSDFHKYTITSRGYLENLSGALLSETFPPGLGTMNGLVPAVHRGFKLEFSGEFTTTGTPTITFDVVVGTTTISTFVLLLPTAGSPLGYRMLCEFTYRTLGATGTADVNTLFTHSDASLNVKGYCTNSELLAIDTDVSQDVVVNATWSVNDALNTISANQATITQTTGI